MCKYPPPVPLSIYAVISKSPAGKSQLTTSFGVECTVVYVKSNNIRFFGKGAGDLYIQANCGIIFSEIYVEDCWKYDPTTHTADEIINFTVGSPNKCKVEFDLTKSASGSGAYITLGDDENNYIGIGLIGSGNYGFFIQHNNSRVTTQTQTGLSNGTFHIELTYNNGSITCKCNNQTFTYTYTQPLTKLIHVAPWNNGNLKNIKIKML